MADNYLEKQYEAYEARKAAWEKERKYGKKPSLPSARKRRKSQKGVKKHPLSRPIRKVLFKSRRRQMHSRHCQSIFLGIPEEVFT